MSDDFFYSLALGFCFLILFLYGEILHRYFDVQAEYTRKIIHVMTGLITLFFPILLNSHLYVLLLCGIFFFILILSLKFKFLPSINKINRISRGSISYPIAVYVCFVFYTFLNNYIFFYLPILILAICDPLAALFGRRFPKGKYTIFKEQKTLIGSAAFLLSAFIVCVILFNGLTGMDQQAIFFMSVIVSVATCSTEAISQKGYDNLSIPFVTLIILITANYLLYIN